MTWCGCLVHSDFPGGHEYAVLLVWVIDCVEEGRSIRVPPPSPQVIVVYKIGSTSKLDQSCLGILQT